MEVSESLYKWLVQLEGLKHPPRLDNGRILISENDVYQFFNGFQFLEISEKLVKDSQIRNLIRSNLNSSSRDFNPWDILQDIFVSIGIPRYPKTLIKSRDYETLKTILEDLKRISSSPIPAQIPSEFPVASGNLKVDKKITDASNCQEFIAISLHTCFRVPLSHISKLFSESNNINDCLNEDRDNFMCLVDWYNLIIDQYILLGKLLSKDTEHVDIVMNLLVSGLENNNIIVLNTCLFALVLVTNSVKVDLWPWFQRSKAIKLIVSAYLVLPNEMSERVFKILLSIGHMTEVFGEMLYYACASPSIYYRTIHEFVSEFSKVPEILIDDSLLKFWTEKAFLTQSFSPECISCILVVLEIWHSRPYYVESQELLPLKIVNEVYSISKMPSKMLKIPVLAQYFRLLSFFRKESRMIYHVYKTLGLIMKENFFDESMREFILRNVMILFKDTFNTYIFISIEKIIQLLGLPKTNFNVCDLDFCLCISSHPMLDIKIAILLLDVLLKMYMNNNVFSATLMIPIRNIAGKFIRAKALHQLITMFIRSNLQILVAKPKVEFIEALMNMIENFILLENHALNESLKSILMNASVQYEKIYKQPLEEILHLTDHVLKDYNTDTIVNIQESYLTENTRDGVHFRSKSEELEKNREIITKKMMIRKQSSFNAPLHLKHRESFISDPTDETENDQSLILSVIKKYSRALKTLFFQYAKKGNKIGETFETFKEQRLHKGQAIKLIRDNNVHKQHISTETIIKIYLELCQKFKIKSLNYDQFLNFLYQISICVFSKGSCDLTRYPPAVSLMALIDIFSSSKIIPPSIYEEPDTGTGDKEVIKQLMRELRLNKELELPYGYTKTTELDIEISHRIPKLFGVPEKHKIVLETLDEIIFNKFNFHIIHPMVKLKTRIGIKGVLNKPEIISNKGVYKAKPLPGYLNFSPSIKLHLASLSSKYPVGILLEAARTLDDLLLSVEKNSKLVISRSPKPPQKIDNFIRQKRRSDEAEHRRVQELTENNRKIRASSLRMDIATHRLREEKKHFVMRKVINTDILDEMRRKRNEEHRRMILKLKVEAYRKKKALEVIEEKPVNKTNKEFFTKEIEKLKIFPIANNSIDEDTYKVLRKYNFSLKILFQTYAKAEKDPENMSLKVFNKFLIDKQIIPCLLDRYVMQRVFNSSSANGQKLTFENFQHSLVTIATIGSRISEKSFAEQSSEKVDALLQSILALQNQNAKQVSK